MTNCTAVVLCGGKSSRMGFDKSLLQLDGEFMLLRTVKQLKKIFPESLLVTNKRSKFPPAFSHVAILEDHYPDKGPLGGLVTALENIKTNYLFLLACDIPNLNIDLIRKMAKSMESYDIVICKQENRLEPLFAFYHVTCLAILKQQLQTNDWRIRKEFEHFLVKVVTLESSFGLENVNSPKELMLWNQ
ncbi:molybdenum cofactor guanylyltransferase [Enterococcus rotai]|uniref:molybdenum cofactor guanylyltransferase n=1 Tax=Enterococcus rotai TaxID=118060 RepID=UPI0035C789B0